MSRFCLSTLNELHDLMKKMLSAVEHSHWDELKTLDKSRSLLLQSDEILSPLPNSERHISNKENTTSHDIERELIKNIRTLDDIILRKATESRRQLLQETRELSAQQRARKSYASTGSIRER